MWNSGQVMNANCGDCVAVLAKETHHTGSGPHLGLRKGINPLDFELNDR